MDAAAAQKVTLTQGAVDAAPGFHWDNGAHGQLCEQQ